MPKIQSETVEITLSKLIKNSDDPTENNLATADLLTTLESVAQELVGDSIIVEVNIK